MTYDDAMRDIAEMLPLMEADERLAAIRARLALAERVVQAAQVLSGRVLRDSDSCEWLQDYNEPLRAALDAWREGKP